MEWLKVQRTADRFFVLTGGDRAGKSTLLANTKSRRRDWAIGSLDPVDWLPHPELPHLNWALEQHPREVLYKLTPHARAALLLTLIMSHWEYWIKPRLGRGDVVIVDSYFYRFYIKERLRRKVPQYFYAALEELTDAAAVIIAELDPEVAFERRADICVNEIFSEPTREDFVHFQTNMLTDLERFCRQRCGQVLRIDASQAPTDLVEQFIATIDRCLNTKAS